jgi:hypothetical protein
LDLAEGEKKEKKEKESTLLPSHGDRFGTTMSL